MTDEARDRLSRHFGLDAEAIRAAAVASARDDSPWYVQVVMAIGAWLAAAAMILTVGLAILPAFADRDLPLTAAGFGVAIAAAAVAIRRGGDGIFVGQLAVALALAGQALFAGGLAVHFESVTVAAAAATGSAALLLVAMKGVLQQFLSAALAVALALAALLESGTPQAAGLLLAATLPAALLLLVRPVASPDLRGLAHALLLVPLAALSVPETGGLNGDWLARTAYAAGLIAVCAVLWSGSAADRRPMVAAAGAVALLLGAVTVAGVLGSLLLLALAYLLGSRMLAAVGAAAHVWMLGRFYYDLDLDLLQKSGTLAAAGLLLLVLWWLWNRRTAEVAADV